MEIRNGLIKGINWGISRRKCKVERRKWKNKGIIIISERGSVDFKSISKDSGIIIAIVNVA